jgi:hypothetical protein
MYANRVPINIIIFVLLFKNTKLKVKVDDITVKIYNFKRLWVALGPKEKEKF